MRGVGVRGGVPLADAWVSQRSEYAADRFAAQRGAGPQLVDALTRMAQDKDRKQSWTALALNPHPSIERCFVAIDRCST